MSEQIPLVDYLVLGDEPHLVANVCTSCGARFFDRRNACAACSGTEFEQTDVATEGTVSTFTIVAFAASCGMSSSGWPQQPPCNAPSWLALDAAGVYAAGLALTGIWMLRQGLEPPRYTVSLREAALAGLTPWTRPLMSTGMTVAGQGPKPARLGAGPYPIYQCLDGYVRVLTGTPRQWQAWQRCG